MSVFIFNKISKLEAKSQNCVKSTLKVFKQDFPADLAAARASYPDARLEEHKDKEGYLFHIGKYLKEIYGKDLTVLE